MTPPHSPAAKPTAATAAPTFEAAMAELQELVNLMEAGQLPLEQSLSAYERGFELIRQCSTQLDKVEQQVKVLENGMVKAFQGSADEDLS
ncbi:MULTISPECIES: exodeoxyribonuclease VII small subunit [unclassified Undibacterium]|uniref:exodeoxyribonuclease VII small subunit n=1 Tax=unclassified Undibacterium TaxID=2630295 RepID=UPI002AC9866B|nr:MULTISPECIES: exodeoxyribonuclease VII small subunit [unclassified Undibacterium]MEB0138672.1 exodeoxyribonuclease VII small subunit [Undibacterium sp. CCC2.1]MEB0171473.1 exodeoxyribonuclease VII small subunit [Undibacterium sp. CCC1.1]MEB0177987.1 exodeoxyribonuclease VII small subunit [Undibacterium sp. CCC3.4]MEB0214368.1 exodeoxyribonuclease VII small subunit [Undibacterium sp. 5I2]WPX44238.1 exodeoxyribonuclease VII small subunit [Undibacterium sp. CCC3.4]